MSDPNGVIVPVICDCGAELHVPVAGLDLHEVEFDCSTCGRKHKFTDEQIARIVANHTALREHTSLREAVAAELRGLLKR